MTEVLGVAIGTFQSSYQSVCQKYSLETKALWSPRGEYHGLPFRRYPWDQFTTYLEDVTQHLRENEIDPIEIQQNNLPSMFKKLGTIRVDSKVFDPKSVIKFVSQYGGPLIFRCCESIFLEEEPNFVGLELKVQKNFRHSTAFFDFCVTGTLSSVRYFGYPSLAIESMHISERRLKVMFRIPSDASSIPFSSRRIEPDADELIRYAGSDSDITQNEASELFAYLNGLANFTPYPLNLELIDELSSFWRKAHSDHIFSENSRFSLSGYAQEYRDLVFKITTFAEKS